MKRFFAVFFMMLLISGCGMSNDVLPALQISSGDVAIPFSRGAYQWGEDDDNVTEDLFITIMQETEKEDLPYIQLGSTIDIVWTENPPNTVEMWDAILTEVGYLKYVNSADPYLLTITDGAASFSLTEDFMAFASSDSTDYEPGATIRGFQFRCIWEETGDSAEYAFILRTDAELYTDQGIR